MLRILIVAVVLVGIALYLLTTPVGSQISSVVDPDSTTASVAGADPLPDMPVSGPIISPVEGYTAISGEVWMDYNNSERGVPFIAYIDSSGRPSTKQLAFVSPNGCRPAAGDLPCVFTGGYTDPSLVNGERITAYGTIQADRLVVEKIERP